MGRKDRERFQRMRGGNPDYVGFRGIQTVVDRGPSPVTVTVVCSVCNRRRNVAENNLPEDVSTFVCLRCQDDIETNAG